MTERIELRPMTRTEYHDFYECYEPDPVMNPRPYRYDYAYADRCYDVEQARADWYPTFGVFLGRDRCIGCLSLKRIDHAAHSCEIGIILQNDGVKGHGYGTQALCLGIRIAREQYDVRHMIAETAENNGRMQHILEKLGFRLTERVPYGFDMVDHWEDKLRYTLEVNG